MRAARYGTRARQGRREARKGGTEAGRREARRQGGRQAGRERGTEAGRQGDKEGDREGEREAGRQAGRQAGRAAFAVDGCSTRPPPAGRHHPTRLPPPSSTPSLAAAAVTTPQMKSVCLSRAPRRHTCRHSPQPARPRCRRGCGCVARGKRAATARRLGPCESRVAGTFSALMADVLSESAPSPAAVPAGGAGPSLSWPTKLYRRSFGGSTCARGSHAQQAAVSH